MHEKRRRIKRCSLKEPPGVSHGDFKRGRIVLNMMDAREWCD
jgi:hypothetical protein